MQHEVVVGLVDVPEIGALIAPRHAVWEVGSRDGLIKPKWADDAITRMRHAYHALNADEHLLVDRFDGGHQWHGKIAHEVLAKVLGEPGIETSAQVATAMKHYARLRPSRVARVQRTARQQGRIYHLSGPMALARDLTIRAMGPARILARQSWIYDWRV